MATLGCMRASAGSQGARDGWQAAAAVTPQTAVTEAGARGWRRCSGVGGRAGEEGGKEEKEAGNGGPYAPVWLDLACEIELHLMITPLGAVASELAAELDRLGAGGAWGTWVVSGVSGVWGVRGR